MSWGNDFLPLMGTGDIGLSDKETEAKFKHTQSQGASAHQPRSLTHGLPTVLEGRSTEAKEGHSSK